MYLQPRDDTLPVCSFVGNSDVYGLGIRVGIYLQWVSSMLSKAFLDEETLRDVWNENAIFLLAIFLATTLLITDTISGAHSLDVLIMLHIFFGSIFTVFLGAANRIEYFSSLMGILFKTGMITGMAAVGVWFWFYHLQQPAEPVCSSFAFLFGRVGLYSKHTVMSFKAFSVINLFYCSAFLLSMLMYRFVVWVYTVASNEPNNSLTSLVTSLFLSPLMGIIASAIGKIASDRKKLLNDLRTHGLELIIESTIPTKGKYIEEWEKIIDETDHGYYHLMGNWQKVSKEIMDWDPRLTESSCFHALLKVLGFFDGPVQQSRENQATRQASLATHPRNLSDSTAPPENTLETIWPSNLATHRQDMAHSTTPPEHETPRSGELSLKLFTINKRLVDLQHSIFVYLDSFNERYAQIGLNFAIFIYSVISIELLIKYNNITDVYTILSTGQIIPFIIGIASLWRTSWTIFVRSVQKHLKTKSMQDETNPGFVEAATKSAEATGLHDAPALYMSKSTQTSSRHDDGNLDADRIEPI